MRPSLVGPRMVYADYEGLGEYKQYLRHSREKRAKRGAEHSGRGQIPNRVGIEARPAEADEKQPLGHFEGDTVVGKGHRGAVVILGEPRMDKAAKFLLAALCPDRTSRSVNEATVSLFKELPNTLLSFTFNNGKEFSKHQELSETLDVPCFFANPYASWERGLNEHTNGLLRQFFPKKTDPWRAKESLHRSLSMPSISSTSDRPWRAKDRLTTALLMR